MELLGVGLYFEDLYQGRQFRTVGRTITETDIISFVNCTGMVEILFTDVEFQKNDSDIKGRLAPAALGYTIAEGLLIQATMQYTAYAFLHMDFNVKGPLFAGDTIHVECEVIEARLSKSKAQRGLVRTRNVIRKQTGEEVVVYTPLRMVKCRN